jgi:Holliday junction resolvasome RuvABC DNA-binding subunit
MKISDVKNISYLCEAINDKQNVVISKHYIKFEIYCPHNTFCLLKVQTYFLLKSKGGYETKFLSLFSFS